MKGKIKEIVFAIITMLLIVAIWPLSITKAADESNQNDENLPTLEFRTDVTEIKKDQKIPVQIFVTDGSKKVQAIDLFVHYNDEIFNELTESDIVPNIDTEDFSYEINEEEFGKDGDLIIVAKDGSEISNGVFATIYLTPKKDVSPNGLKVNLLKLYNGMITYKYGGSKNFEDQEIAAWPKAEELEKLYLNTDVYKIGEGNINQYEEDDRYISRVEPLTTLSSFKSNLVTNGNIKVLKPDGTELEDEENKYVGTGMTLVVTKDEGTDKEQKIKLKISVKGDVARSKQEGDTSDENLKCGDGQVTMIDINRVNLVCINKIDLEDEFKIAADMNESGSISIIDLLRINFIIIGVNK